RRDLHDLLRHDADVGLAAAVIAKAIEAKTIVQIAEKNDVMLEPDVGAPTPAAAPAATPTTAAAAAGAHATTAAAAACAQATAATPATAADVCMPAAPGAIARSSAAMRRPRFGTCALPAAMRSSGTLTGTMAFADIGASAAGFGAGPSARPIADTGSIAGLVARPEHLLTATAAKIALTSTIAGLPMIDPRLPPITAAGNGMRGPIPRRRDVDVVAAAAPVDVAAPIAS